MNSLHLIEFINKHKNNNINKIIKKFNYFPKKNESIILQIYNYFNQITYLRNGELFFLNKPFELGININKLELNEIDKQVLLLILSKIYDYQLYYILKSDILKIKLYWDFITFTNIDIFKIPTYKKRKFNLCNNIPIENRLCDNQPIENRLYDNQPIENRLCDNQPIKNRLYDNQPIENRLCDNIVCKPLLLVNNHFFIKKNETLCFFNGIIKKGELKIDGTLIIKNKIQVCKRGSIRISNKLLLNCIY